MFTQLRLLVMKPEGGLQAKAWLPKVLGDVEYSDLFKSLYRWIMRDMQIMQEDKMAAVVIGITFHVPEAPREGNEIDHRAGPPKQYGTYFLWERINDEQMTGRS